MFTQDHMERIIPMLCVQNISYVPDEYVKLQFIS